MTIKAFGSNQDEMMRLKEYQVVMKPLDKSTSMYVKALAVPRICALLSTQNIALAMVKNEFLRNLNLADNGDNKGGVDMLIGANMYWKVVNGNMKKDNNSGLIAISSMFGWLINGPVASKPGESSINCITHVMSIQSESNEDKILAEKISNFWNLDLLGITEGEEKESNALSEVSFKNGCYEVQLPFCKNHPALADNYTLSRKRLEQLKQRLDKHPTLKKDYNDIFQEQMKAGVIEKVTDNGQKE